MATFTNQATLTYGTNTVNSNIVTGEILETLSINKSAVKETYNGMDLITYVININNTGNVPFNGIQIEDNLGEYTFGTGTVVPETFDIGSVQLTVNGTPAEAPTVAVTEPLTFTGINVPAGSTATLTYSVRPNQYTPLATGSTITNVATATGAGLTAPIQASATITADNGPALMIEKAVNPTIVTENGTITYTFTIRNYGNEAANENVSAVVSDTFNPIIDITNVTFNNNPLIRNTQYNYDQATGDFATVPGIITVPAATYTQSETGEITTTPGVSTLTVTGTV